MKCAYTLSEVSNSTWSEINCNKYEIEVLVSEADAEVKKHTPNNNAIRGYSWELPIFALRIGFRALGLIGGRGGGERG